MFSAQHMQWPVEFHETTEQTTGQAACSYRQVHCSEEGLAESSLFVDFAERLGGVQHLVD